jgi:hypothetical protein
MKISQSRRNKIMPAEVADKRFYKVYTRHRTVGGGPMNETASVVIAKDFGEAESKVRGWYAETNTRGVVDNVRVIEDVTASYGTFIV